MVEFYDGADKLNVGNTNTQPEAPNKAQGGPVQTFDGGNTGCNHSKTTPSYDAKGMPQSGNTVKGPMDV